MKIKKEKLISKISEIEKLIYKFYNQVKSKVLYPLKKLKLLHELLKQVDDEKLQEAQRRNTYQLFFDWFLDVVQFGFICLICYSAFFGWAEIGKSILLIFGFGVIPDIISRLRKPIIGDQ